MNKYIVGIDIGGTSAKCALFDISGKLIAFDGVRTDRNDGFGKTVASVGAFAISLAEKGGAHLDEIAAVGIGVPGVIDSERGIVRRWSNFGWRDVPLAAEMKKIFGKEVYIANDANVAALGEAKYGATAEYQSSIMITVGTGIGGGIVYNGELIEGYKSAGAELGHITIREGGIPCSCGRRGCYEKYASATALVRQTRLAMAEDLDSKMWETVGGDIKAVSGKTAFEAMRKGDPTAKKVVEQYVGYLSEGIADFVNILRPEAIVLGGGVSNEGEALFEPLRKAVDDRTYIAMDIVPLKIVGAKLGNKAGAYGAFAIAKEKSGL